MNQDERKRKRAEIDKRHHRVAYRRAWRLAHPELVREYQNRANAKRRDKQAAYSTKYYQVHKEEKSRYYRALHPKRERPCRTKEAIATYRKGWRTRRKEHVRIVNQLWYRRIKDDPIRWAMYLVRAAAYREANRKKVNEATKQYYRRNPDKYKAKKVRRAARLKNAVGSFTGKQWAARVAYYGYRCAYCEGSLMGAPVHADHVIPLALGGTNWASNMVPSCPMCNLRKNTKRWLPARLHRYLDRINAISESG